jgi:peptide/nickel transport system permease protein
MSTVAAPPPAAVRASRRVRLPGVGWVGLAIVAAFVAVGIAGPALAPYGVHALAGDQLARPGGAHLLGTNSVGQDVFSQMLVGTRVSLLVALLAGGGTLLIGATVGMLAGWLGGRVELVLMRVVDVFLVVPRIPLVVVVAAYAGSSLPVIAAIIAATSWPPSARVIRSQVLSLRGRAHLRASTGFGAGTFHVLRRHVVPELSLLLTAGLVAAVERAIALEAGLAFLGLGDPSRESWGAIMRDALAFEALFFTPAWWWWLLPPVVALCILLLGVTLIGVALEERINPRLARHVAGGTR